LRHLIVLENPQKILIVGAGLAGTLMAWELLKRKIQFQVWDNGSPSASSVAAGMYNPLSFKRLVEVWNASPHMNAMQQTYEELQEFLGITVLHPTPIIRIFPNDQYRDLWQRRYDTGHDVAIWIGPALQAEEAPEGIVAPYGFGVVRDAGWVDVAILIEAMRSFLNKEGRFRVKSWDMSTTHNFDSVIDCRGVGAKEDLATEGLKLDADHGEILTIKSDTLTTDGKILNRVKWLLPTAHNTFKLGATYEWNVADSKPTEKGKIDLLESIAPILSEEIAKDFTIINHESGLRPTSHDRRPFVGVSKYKKEIYILNGLGTRGVLIGPSVTNELASHILDGVELSKEINTKRIHK
jgi:glycine oxidase